MNKENNNNIIKYLFYLNNRKFYTEEPKEILDDPKPMQACIFKVMQKFKSYENFVWTKDDKND